MKTVFHNLGVLFMSPIEPHAATVAHICAIPVVFFARLWVMRKIKRDGILSGISLEAISHVHRSSVMSRKHF